MFKSITKNVGLAALGGALLVASAASFAGISTTKHNLGSNGTGDNSYSGTGEICVFCHTPHGADTGAPVPLWNRNLPTGTTYTTYDSLGTSSLDGTIISVGSVSLACLSCHDGGQAMDSIINAPGSGLAGDNTWQAGTWTGNDRPQGIANIGTDLRDDHPIGIQYGGGGVVQSTCTNDGANCTATLGDADFFQPRMRVINTQPIWWVSTDGNNATREKTDIQLYTRSDAAAANENEPFVECASCHDPHTDNTTFLRVVNTDSAVCLACHDK
ncbi:cytochrome c3 family protein [Aestuariirhabdus sp. LZHN29]|uniref:cytochrome c3 family protein n=1 Tax=Aestuariirhabdus sp. LZHN29 TaxID=3417462 RepID=UPI003CEBCAF0